MMKENFLRRTWDFTSQQQDAVPPRQEWANVGKPSSPVNTDRKSSTNFLQFSPLFIVCLLISLLLIIGAIIVIALIPLYLQNKSADVPVKKSNAKNITMVIDVDQNLPVGPLSANEIGSMMDVIKASLPASVLQGGTLRIISAEIVLVPNESSRNVRQAGFRKVLRIVFEIISQIATILQTISNSVSATITANIQIVQQAAQQLIENRPSTTSTVSSTTSISTIPPNVISTAAAGRRRRQEMVESAATTQGPVVTYED